jgi:hypothetical protein
MFFLVSDELSLCDEGVKATAFVFCNSLMNLPKIITH